MGARTESFDTVGTAYGRDRDFCSVTFVSNLANQLRVITSFIGPNAVFIGSLEVGQLSSARAEIGIYHAKAEKGISHVKLNCPFEPKR